MVVYRAKSYWLMVRGISVARVGYLRGGNALCIAEGRWRKQTCQDAGPELIGTQKGQKVKHVTPSF